MDDTRVGVYTDTEHRYGNKSRRFCLPPELLFRTVLHFVTVVEMYYIDEPMVREFLVRTPTITRAPGRKRSSVFPRIRRGAIKNRGVVQPKTDSQRPKGKKRRKRGNGGT